MSDTTVAPLVPEIPATATAMARVDPASHVPGRASIKCPDRDRRGCCSDRGFGRGLEPDLAIGELRAVGKHRSGDCDAMIVAVPLAKVADLRPRLPSALTR